MADKYIRLLSEKRMSIDLMLSNEFKSHQVSEMNFAEMKKVFSNEYYNFNLCGFELSNVKKIGIYINGDEEEFRIEENTVEFKTQIGKKNKIFENRFGYADIQIDVEYEEGEREHYYTDYLSIMVPRNQNVDEIVKMVEYVYANYDQLVSSTSSGSKTMGDLKKSTFIDLGTRISLAEDILTKYKNSFGYFSINSRFKTEVVEEVDDAQKLNSLTPKTMQFIATHPSLLKPHGGQGGIKVGGNSYIPNKTLIEKKGYSRDIYENQVIIGFVRKIISDLNELASTIEEIKQHGIKKPDEHDEFVQSSYFIFKSTSKLLEESLIRANKIVKEFEKIYFLYKNAMLIDGMEINNMPKPTAIFLSVPQYHNIFNGIYMWFKYGLYDFGKEKFMLSFVDTSTLYEVYVLSKLLSAVKFEGYNLESSRRYVYKMPKNSKYANTICSNTFEFSRNNENITLYYQPVIYDGKSTTHNGIELYRNNSITFQEDDEHVGFGQFYYAPDYIIKHESNAESTYLIIDAKYSARISVINYKIKDIAFKYGFSITPRDKEIIRGINIIYGKTNSAQKKESVYDKVPIGCTIQPKYNIIPITEGINNNLHSQYLSELIREC